MAMGQTASKANSPTYQKEAALIPTLRLLFSYPQCRGERSGFEDFTLPVHCECCFCLVEIESHRTSDLSI